MVESERLRERSGGGGLAGMKTRSLEPCPEYGRVSACRAIGKERKGETEW